LEQESFDSHALLIGIFEYITDYNRYPSFHLSHFINVDNVYANINKIDLFDLQTCVGFDGRWKLTYLLTMPTT